MPCRRVLVSVLACVLTACGGSGHKETPRSPPGAFPVRGPVEVTSAALDALFAQPPADPGGPDENDECDDAVDCDPVPALVARSKGSGALVAPLGGAQALDQTPPLTANWGGLTSAAWAGLPPDPQIAVSTTHVVITMTRWIAFYTKAGSLLKSTSSRTFFAPLGLDTGGAEGIDIYSDMRVVFDDYRKRFWVCSLARSNLTNASPQLDPDRRRSLVTVAVSRTEDPNDGWIMYWWDAAVGWGDSSSDVWIPGDVADYTMIGIGPDALHEVHKIGNPEVDNLTRYWRVTIADADAMAAGNQSIQGSSYWGMKNPDGSRAGLVQPVVHHGPTGRAYYVSRSGSTDLVIWALTGALTANQRLEKASITLKEWTNPLNAPQPGSSLGIAMTNLGTSPLKAVFRWPYLYLCTMDAAESGGALTTAVRYVRVQVADFPSLSTAPSDGFISRVFGGSGPGDPPGSEVHCGWPALEVNRDGDTAVVYARSGTAVYPEARYSTYLASESDIRPSRILRAGEAAYGYTTDKESLRWGDLAGASVDPKDATSIWIVHEYARASGSSNNWGLWIGKVFGLTYLDWGLPGLTLDGVDGTGKTFSFSGRLANDGDGAGPAGFVTVEVLHDGMTSEVGTIKFPALDPGGSWPFHETMPLPDGITSGAHLLRLTVTSSGPEEYTDKNNSAEVTLPVP